MTTYDFGGDGTIMTLAVANGFPPIVYQPLMIPFTADYKVMALPPRALMPNEEPPEELKSWKDTLAADMIATLQGGGMRGVFGVGHSFGGIATLLAAIAEPDRFKAVILLDPTILMEADMIKMRVQQENGNIDDNPLATRADKRRDRFESREEAYEYFKGKRLFADWPDATVRLYADSLDFDGDGYTLAWPRAWEAYYFRTLYTYTWDELPRLAATDLPLLIIRGGESDTLLPEAVERMQTILPDATFREIAGHGHLFPQSAPEETRAIINTWLDEQDIEIL